MSEYESGRRAGAAVHEEDVISILVSQHERIRELFAQVKAAEGDTKRHAFDELRAMLAVHETAEELVVRPVSKKAAGAAVADARNREEKEATKVLEELEKMDVSSPKFAAKFAAFEQSVLDHAGNEESEEFPVVRASRSAEELARMGKIVRSVEKFAPTHPHSSAAGSPMAQMVLGPFASIVDRVRDALSGR
jgi:hemerythrin superfamily protein